MCGQLIMFPIKWSPMELEALRQSFERLLQEVREFREVADSLPPTRKKPGIKTTPDYLG